MNTIKSEVIEEVNSKIKYVKLIILTVYVINNIIIQRK